ncbi:hypothetical protein K456DRAFT_444836 [Colletotrichum gloeosporioides 23]|nr:hypothetical protein K456DRAFT_444836 [Colletotrichum gloeosporioides 23]
MLLCEAHQLSQRNTSWLKSCSCRPRIETNSMRLWSFQVQNFRRNDHRDDCPYRLSGTRLWSHSWSAHLRPFLDRVLEISLGASTGPGGTWTIFLPLRCRKFVERSKSPVFSAFDRLVELSVQKKACRMRASKLQSWWSDNSCQKDAEEMHFYEIQWQPCTRQNLKNLDQCLRDEISHGRFSGEETDQNGFTILFEFCNLVILMNRQLSHFETEMRALLRTILRSRVDVTATVVFNESLRRFGYENFYASSWVREFVTAAEYLLHRGHTSEPILGWQIAFYDEFLQKGMIEGLQNYSNDAITEGLHSEYGLLPLRLFMRHVEVAEGKHA